MPTTPAAFATRTFSDMLTTSNKQELAGKCIRKQAVRKGFFS
jgi:hypothetical protein